MCGLRTGAASRAGKPVPDVRISIAANAEHAALDRAYVEWGYHGGILDTDVVYVARIGGRPVGIVRRAEESGVTMLRGMFLAPEFRRRGMGTQLLRAFVADMPVADCHCIPFSHLVGFYSQGGFTTLDESRAEAFLRERLRVYRAEGHDVILMRRAASDREDRS